MNTFGSLCITVFFKDELGNARTNTVSVCGLGMVRRRDSDMDGEEGSARIPGEYHTYKPSPLASGDVTGTSPPRHI